MADITTTTATSTGGCSGNGFKRRSRKQNKHVELSPWIVDMINIVEPKDCSTHRTNRLDRFCIKCVQPFCNECSSNHDGHEHLQICRYSYSCVVKRPDFQKHFDCSGVQSYKTNNNRVLYIKQKRAIQQVKEEQINTKKVCCIVCNLTIIDEDYCSIECKITAVYKNGNIEWVTYDKNVKSTEGAMDDNNVNNTEGVTDDDDVKTIEGATDNNDVSNTEEAKDDNNVSKGNGKDSENGGGF
ncbi:hypothetical protein CTI12_AA398690 [Artemisia annua]|uniref:B box-type domain-containing protein n=1 Tax=Artemisia annua TaxID=35608 RepID=A0A2U1MBA9_ARTAN|nr:hypothetical protein CTI12_AA398690 [Artemisia annua]